MVAAALVLLCTKPLDATIFEAVPWLLTVPSIAIISREVIIISLFHILLMLLIKSSIVYAGF